MSILSGKVLTITGGTGSFGTTFLHQALKTDISEVRIFSRDELKQNDMRHRISDKRVRFYLGDIKDRMSLIPAMQGTNFVFNAAALKQVPSCESFPLEAVKTNIFGAQNAIEAALNAGAEKIICLSTDKAVYPINAMGISKAMMERVALAAARNTSRTTICCTRYGNVTSSRGSVVPLFIEQIKGGKPLTVTDPSMTRFMMSLEESVDLVLYALDKGKPGDLFVRKAPAATIGTLADALKGIFSYTGKTIIIGARPGDKAHESLLTREEMARAEDIGNYFRVPLEYGNSMDVTAAAGYTSDTTMQLDLPKLYELLLSDNYIQDVLRG